MGVPLDLPVLRVPLEQPGHKDSEALQALAEEERDQRVLWGREVLQDLPEPRELKAPQESLALLALQA